MTFIKRILPGTLIILSIASVSILINSILKDHFPLETLTYAIILGIIFGNFFYKYDPIKPGISFSLKTLLKWGIILIGFKINMVHMVQLGKGMLISVTVAVPMIITAAVIIGRLFGKDHRLSTLIGVGSGICGASAVVAVAPCIEADENDTILAVSVVSFLGAIGVLVYSFIAASGASISNSQYGFWSGISLHGVAHAIAAAYAKGTMSGEIGTVIKMARVIMLVPVSLGLSYLYHMRSRKGQSSRKHRVQFPYYVLFFIFAGLINSSGVLPESISTLLSTLGGFFILMAMTAMGLSVNFSHIKSKGKSALFTGSLLFLVVSIVTFFVARQLL